MYAYYTLTGNRKSILKQLLGIHVPLPFIKKEANMTATKLMWLCEELNVAESSIL